MFPSQVEKLKGFNNAVTPVQADPKKSIQSHVNVCMCVSCGQRIKEVPGRTPCRHLPAPAPLPRRRGLGPVPPAGYPHPPGRLLSPPGQRPADAPPPPSGTGVRQGGIRVGEGLLRRPSRGRARRWPRHHDGAPPPRAGARRPSRGRARGGPRRRAPDGLRPARPRLGGALGVGKGAAHVRQGSEAPQGAPV